jgi:hypothetical protein
LSLENLHCLNGGEGTRRDQPSTQTGVGSEHTCLAISSPYCRKVVPPKIV